MKRSIPLLWVLVLLSILIPMAAQAAVVADPSHFGLAVGINCNTCHQTNRTFGQTKDLGPINRTSPAVYNNICQSCHRPGDGFGHNKPMALVDASAIFGDHSTSQFGNLRQTSHRWDGSDTNPAAGAQPPIQAAMTTNTNGVLNLRGRSGNQLSCVRCHAPHLANAPGAMLRMANDQNQLCMDCHRTRNQASHISGTHPVNINYAANRSASPGLFNDLNNQSISNANPANNTSNLNNYLTTTNPPGNIVCTTCHGVHYTDSRSSTFDGASTAKGKGNYVNLSTGDGYLLRTDRRGAAVSSGVVDKLNICSNCHANKKSHNARGQDVQCNDCHSAHVDYDANNNTTINPLNKNNVYLVRRHVKNGTMPSSIYFRYTGSSREYVNSSGTGVCEGCHVVPPAGGKYPAQHDSSKAGDCNTCHFHSSAAGSFSGACGQCHGFPPTNNTIGGPNGLANPATGALAGAVGAHATHVTTGVLKMECNACHSGYAARPMPNRSIDIGFDVNGVNVPGFTNVLNTGTANYINTNPLQATYTAKGFTGNVLRTGANQTCVNIYCHGATLTGATKINPSWVGTNQALCGTCHGADSANPPLTKSHDVHASDTGNIVIQCASCHGSHIGNSHVNGNVKWNMTAINGKYKTPTGRSYSSVGSTGKLAPSTSYGGYGTCNNIYCHGSATAIPWGGSLRSTTDTCAKCHSSFSSYSTSKSFYSTSYPTLVTINTDGKVGAHVSHLGSTDGIASRLHCEDCHGTVTLNNGTHMNQARLTNFVFGAQAKLNGANPSYSASNGKCSNVYCHGGKMPNGSAGVDPTWNVAFLPLTLTLPGSCNGCHGFPPTNYTTGSHIAVATTNTLSDLALCAGCHPNVNGAATGYNDVFVDKSKHINGIVEGGSCNGCHGYPPANKRFNGTQNNWSSARMEDYSGAGGAHTVAGHVPPGAKPSEGFTNCSNCHNSHAPSPKVFNPSSNIKVSIASRVRFSNVAPQVKYSSNKLDGNAHITGRCTNIACHFQKSPKW